MYVCMQSCMQDCNYVCKRLNPKPKYKANSSIKLVVGRYVDGGSGWGAPVYLSYAWLA